MLTFKNVNLWHRHLLILTFLQSLTTVIVEGISSEELYIMKPKATCHITW